MTATATLIDAGPLIALIDSAHAATHQKCVAAVKAISQPVVTTLPCFTEAMYFLGELSGWRGQAALWRYVEARQIIFHSQTADEWMRMRQLWSSIGTRRWISLMRHWFRWLKRAAFAAFSRSIAISMSIASMGANLLKSSNSKINVA